jgi:hypothetical protein
MLGNLDADCEIKGATKVYRLSEIAEAKLDARQVSSRVFSGWVV